jgi:hypothetical protein
MRCRVLLGTRLRWSSSIAMPLRHKKCGCRTGRNRLVPRMSGLLDFRNPCIHLSPMGGASWSIFVNDFSKDHKMLHIFSDVSSYMHRFVSRKITIRQCDRLMSKIKQIYNQCSTSVEKPYTYTYLWNIEFERNNTLTFLGSYWFIRIFVYANERYGICS